MSARGEAAKARSRSFATNNNNNNNNKDDDDDDDDNGYNEGHGCEWCTRRR